MEMTKTLNAHQVFFGATSESGFRDNITIQKSKLDLLREAREAIRQTLRQAVPTWGNFIGNTALFDSVLLKSQLTPSIIRPKFRLQGSMAYHTLNSPAQTPPQEIDCDDGMFLPVSFLEQGGSTRPSVISSGLFSLVEESLKPLCAARSWVLNPSKPKPSCVRVQIDKNSHVDIALYAIPDSDFQALAESAAFDSVFKADSQHDDIELSDFAYKRLPQDHILLAHREEGWKPSDPRKLEDWFNGSVERYGQQLRRVCRYIKAWRDFEWGSCRLSSIALMHCAVSAFQAIETKSIQNRDDLALSKVADLLPGLLSQSIPNPVVPGQMLDEGWSVQERNEFVEKATQFSQRVSLALNNSDDAMELLQRLSSTLGDRIPRNTNLVKDESPDDPNSPTTKITTSSSILSRGSTPKEPVIKSGGGRYA
jgi:hypothetical protein